MNQTDSQPREGFLNQLEFCGEESTLQGWDGEAAGSPGAAYLLTWLL